MSDRRRTTLVTALPLTILLIFGVIGLLASRASERAGARDGQSGMPFAIAEPVKARWESTAAANATFTYEIEAPKAARERSYELTHDKITLDNTRDVKIGRSRCNAPDFGFLVNNGAKAERVVIDGLTVSEAGDYGGYIDGASDWWIRNSILHQAKDAREHGLRIASGSRIRISDTLIDSHLGDKTTLWVLNGDHIELRNVKLVGGRNALSIPPDNPDLPDGSVTDVIIADCWIDVDQEWPNAFELMPGTDRVTITNLHVRAAKPPIGVWSSQSGVPAARNIRWKDIWVPAPGQPADKPFDELEWVKLRDDDLDRIISHKGRTREEIKADGIGPIE
jgi:hypothetical protein